MRYFSQSIVYTFVTLMKDYARQYKRMAVLGNDTEPPRWNTDQFRPLHLGDCTERIDKALTRP